MSNGNEFSAPGGGGTKGGVYETGVNTRANTEIIPKGWHKPLPLKLPTPAYWPVIMALGITFILWGLAVGFNEIVSTMIILIFVGLSLFLVALIGWIGDLRNERKDQNE